MCPRVLRFNGFFVTPLFTFYYFVFMWSSDNSFVLSCVAANFLRGFMGLMGAGEFGLELKFLSALKALS